MSIHFFLIFPMVFTEKLGSARLFDGIMWMDGNLDEGISQSTMQAPSYTLVMGDGSGCASNGTNDWWCNEEMFVTDGLAGSSYQHLYNDPKATGRHLESNDILYADGHVKAKRMRFGDGNFPPGPNGGHPVYSNGNFTWVNLQAGDLPK